MPTPTLHLNAFDDSFDSAPRYVQEIYEPDENGESYYFKKRAILQSMEWIIEYMNENKRCQIMESEFINIV